MTTNRLATRDGFGQALLDAGAIHKDVVVVSCDLPSATRTQAFQNTFPNRFFEVGIAEQNGISVAAGLALGGMRPFISSFGAFITGRYDQIRISVAYNNAGVVVVGTHAGLAIGKDGATQMGLEDITLMSAIPGMHVYQPADANEAKQIVDYLTQNQEMAYLRLSRTPLPNALGENYVFKPGKLQCVSKGKDILVVATGDKVYQSLEAKKALEDDGILPSIVNCSTLKPFDADGLLEMAKDYQIIVTVEDHSKVGALGSRVSETIAHNDASIKVVSHGIDDCFGESATPDDLYRKHKLDAPGIAEVIKFTANQI